MDHKQVPIDAKAAKPTLMGQPALTPLADDGDSNARILSDVKVDPSAAARGHASRTGSTFKAIGALGLAAVVAFFGYQYLSGTANEGMLATDTKPANAKAAKAQNPIIDEQAAPLPAAVAAPQEAAQIVNDVDAAKAAPPANSEAKLTAALEEGVKPPKATIQKALESKQSAKSQSTQKVVTTTKAVDKVPSAIATKDKDVNLLAAIITHNTAPVASTEVKQLAVARTGPPSIAKPAGETTLIDTAPAPASSGAQSAEAQLKKCNELGFFDRELCRVKTCSNLWETNAACKATLSPDPVATAEAQKAAAQKANQPVAQTSGKTTSAQSIANAKATELQLKQCSELSFFEREVCRVKTCNGQWENNAACKATLSPDPVATAEASRR
jgi:hypothetical protein